MASDAAVSLADRRILLVEDNPADVRLTEEVMRDSDIQVSMDVVRDGEEAMDFLRCRGDYGDAVRPDLILLDLNLPRMSGRELLRQLKADEDLRRIPVVILSTSKAEHDVAACYDLHANSYFTKPVDLDDFVELIHTIQDYWLLKAQLPPTC